MKLLVANRGEIAIRIMRAAAELNIRTVGIYSQDDAVSLHTAKADETFKLSGMGSHVYRNIDQIIQAAQNTECDAIHPGYGFLSESSEFARRCSQAGILLIGSKPEQIQLFSDKTKMREVAIEAGVPVVPGIEHAITIDDAIEFLAQLDSGSSAIIKAIFGSKGRAIQIVSDPQGMTDLFARCKNEALGLFGNDDLYIEQFLPATRHIEVQILGDSAGNLIHLGERDCSIQHHFQKLVEVAPAPNLDPSVREQMINTALMLAEKTKFEGVGTFEFLVPLAEESKLSPFYFSEVDAHLPCGHSVTEEVYSVDIVKVQLGLAAGHTLKELELDNSKPPKPLGFAIQTLVALESIRLDDSIHPTHGTITAYETPTGPGIRTDGFGYVGYTNSLLFEPLLAKVIGHSKSTDFFDAIVRTKRALDEFRLEGIEHNLSFLRAILEHETFGMGLTHTQWVEEDLKDLAFTSRNVKPRFVTPAGGISTLGNDDFGAEEHPIGPDGSVGLGSPIQGTIVEIGVAVGDDVQLGQAVAVVEAMKLQHDIKAERSGKVVDVSMAVGDVVREGYPIVFVEESDSTEDLLLTNEEEDLDAARTDMQEFHQEVARNLDPDHTEAVHALHSRGARSARENIFDLVDEDSFREFGPAASGSASGGTIIGIASVNAQHFGDEDSRVAVIHNNHEITTTTNGAGHYRQEPIHELVHDFQIPLVIFSEGEGRPYIGSRGFQPGVGGFDGQLFSEFAKLSGLVPLVGISTGPSFGPNATLLACCDVIIATQNASIGMGGGPKLVEAAGMGKHTAEDLGSMSFQAENGNVDIVVENDEAAISTAQQYLSYFQGQRKEWKAPDQRRMRHIIPENRVRTYDMREIMNTLADEGSVLEIRREFGVGVITAFIRVEGRPMGLVANNPAHLAGAVDSPGADKGARFLQLCDAFDIPVVVLMDCPGIMVGPDHERTALVRHAVRMFNVGGNCTTAMFGIMVRKAYGLGVQAMCGGSAMIPFFSVAWPTAEFAGMNIDGAVKLSARRELMAIEDPEARKAAYDQRVSDGYETARAINSGARYVIDPAETRDWITRGLKSLPPKSTQKEKKRPYVDTW